MRWIVCISGFRQHNDNLHGVAKLWQRMLRFSSPTTQVLLLEWDSDMDALAKRIAMMNDAPRINICAHSWGCGHGTLKLCNALLDCGIDVEHASLCDPVYHSSWFPWLALLTYFRPDIWLPPNVREVHSFVQKTERPMGFRVKGYADTKVNPQVVIPNVTHGYISEHSEWHNNALKYAARLHAS